MATTRRVATMRAAITATDRLLATVLEEKAPAAVVCALGVLDCSSWRVRWHEPGISPSQVDYEIASSPEKQNEKEIVGNLNAELAKRYAAYVLLPPLITFALGLLGAWVLSSFERRGALRRLRADAPRLQRLCTVSDRRGIFFARIRNGARSDVLFLRRASAPSPAPKKLDGST